MTSKTINLRPSPAGYANALILILENSMSPEDRAWAREQIVNAFKVAAQLNPQDWGIPKD